MSSQEHRTAIPEQARAARVDAPPRATRWLTRGFETLLAERAADDAAAGSAPAPLDVVVVGSGYGGAVAASEIARRGAGATVCVLERGRERLPGSFPARFADLAGDVRFSIGAATHSRGEPEGLFDVRVGPDVSVVVANGVGGGSLINAGVMELPSADVFDDPHWPAALRGQQAQIDALAQELRDWLGPVAKVGDTGEPLPAKVAAMQALGQGVTFRQVPITVALAPGDTFTTRAGIRVDRCIGCGDCATGCNHNAKLSLDATLLARARQAGADLVAGATVLCVRRVAQAGAEPLWELDVVHTDTELRRRQGEPLKLRARCVVLAAGTLGSTEILLRSRAHGLALSDRLGDRFSANGDMMAVAYGTGYPVHAVNDESTPLPADPAARCGPTIATMIDLRASGGGVIQDMSVPGPLRWIMQETVTTAAALDMLKEADLRPWRGPVPGDPCAVDPGAIDRSLMVAMLGRDSASGTLKLHASTPRRWFDGDGGVSVDWPKLGEDPGFLARQRALEQRFAASGVGGRVLANPLWRLLPDQLEFLFGGAKGSLVTVHPLGGCPMGDDAARGVVDDCGRVFDAAPDGRPGSVHAGLHVLDGAIIPTSLGINPSLTIASVALRAVRRLCDERGWADPVCAPRPDVRPVFAPAPAPVRPRPTEIEIVERLSGALRVAGIVHQGRALRRPVWVELTLRFAPARVADIIAPTGAAALVVESAQGRLRIFEAAPRSDEDGLDADALVVASVQGTLKPFQRVPSSPLRRGLRGLWAWFRNRGLRDTVLAVIDWVAEKVGGRPAGALSTGTAAPTLRGRVVGAVRLATRAGDQRLLAYDLNVDRILARGPGVDVEDAVFVGQPIRGRKTFTYGRRSNPWTQLMTLQVDCFPALRAPGPLVLDTGFLAREGQPLLRVVGQQDGPRALAEVGSLLLFLARMTLQVHAWSFRAPDVPKPRAPQRLPGALRGPKTFDVACYPVGRTKRGETVHVRLTHYPGKSVPGGERWQTGMPLPVVLFHGYSVSGNTFTHPAIRPNLAEFLWRAGRDVWVVDLRTSAGMGFPTLPWTFEQVAHADIPMAIQQVLDRSGADKVDILAHCMGSAMLSMALLRPHPAAGCWTRAAPLRACVNSLAISQVPPAVVMTPANVFRAYMMRALKNFLPISDYQFRTPANPGFLDQLIDRLLATLPYPEDEFDIENPFWRPWKRTPWVGTRHRMDALYGRDFNVENMPGRVLDAIDDLFGPLNIDTVSQAIHFATDRTITDGKGANRYVEPRRLRETFGSIPLFGLHGAANGLADVASAAHWKQTLVDCDVCFADERAFSQRIVQKHGHQDCLVGRDARQNFAAVLAFFDSHAPRSAQPQPMPASRPVFTFTAVVPSFGVRADGATRYSIGDSSGRGVPFAVFLVPVVAYGDGYLPANAAGTAEPDPAHWGGLIRVTSLRPIDTAPTARLQFEFDLGAAALPPGATGVLVLAVYNQSNEIGLPQVHTRVETVTLQDFGALVSAPAAAVEASEGHLHAPRIAPPFGSPSWWATITALMLTTIIEELTAAAKRAFDRIGPSQMEMSLLRAPVSPVAPVAVAVASAAGGGTFAVASCQYPGGLLDRTPPGTPLDRRPGPADASLEWLAARLDEPAAKGRPAPTELLLLGDQIYADASAGLFDPRVQDDRLRLSYEALLGARGPRRVLCRLKTTMRFDDHEIIDNWEPDPPHTPARETGFDDETLLSQGLAAYVEQQLDQTPAAGEPRPRWDSTRSIAGRPLFLADARSLRTPRDAASAGSASILGDAQFAALEAWLDATPAGVCFVTSASMVLPRRRIVADSSCIATALRSDAWDGYPASLHQLLGLVHRHGRDRRRGIVFLSGDEHIFNRTRITLTSPVDGRTVVAHSIHASALYAPWPFANSAPSDFANDESFEFTTRVGTSPETLRCSVQAVHVDPPGDGHALLTVPPDAAALTVDVSFDGPTRAACAPYTLRFDAPDPA